jgi:hypothetical protein
MNINENFYIYMYMEVLTFVERLMVKWCTAGWKAHKNFADELIYYILIYIIFLK